MTTPVDPSRNLAAWVIVAAWVTTLAINAPGHLSFDSVVQFLEGRTGIYGNMHPLLEGRTGICRNRCLCPTLRQPALIMPFAPFR